MTRRHLLSPHSTYLSGRCWQRRHRTPEGIQHKWDSRDAFHRAWMPLSDTGTFRHLPKEGETCSEMECPGARQQSLANYHTTLVGLLAALPYLRRSRGS